MIDFIVLRQPTRKQRILSPVWGRAIWEFNLDEFSGPAIVIEAQRLSPIVWPRSLNTQQTRELERLRKDGHTVHRTRCGIEIRTTHSSLRTTVLYRTLLHELGHHVDYQRWSVDEWRCKAHTEKEDFAHRYAQEIYMELSMRMLLPFPSILIDESLQADSLHREWFSLS
ncbi:MAG: hypothetical protein V4857_29735 [Pseudomonadota bacterium]